MIFDSTNMFSLRQAVTVAAPSTDVIDRGAPGVPRHGRAPGFRHDVGKGTTADLAVLINQAFAGPLLHNLRIRYQVSPVEDFSSGVIDAFDLRIPVAALLPSNRFAVPLTSVPVGASARFHRMHYVGFQADNTTAVVMTAGQITAGIVAGRDEWWL